PKRDTEFARHILIEGKPLVCEGDAAIARIFEDYEKIRVLGLHSSINAPVLGADGRVAGVLNFLFSEQTVAPDRLRSACAVAAQAEIIAALSLFNGAWAFTARVPAPRADAANS
ncbi:MAG: GAF domain-containing protein, partial [Betaproteobacteria bacterium]